MPGRPAYQSNDQQTSPLNRRSHWRRHGRLPPDACIPSSTAVGVSSSGSPGDLILQNHHHFGTNISGVWGQSPHALPAQARLFADLPLGLALQLIKFLSLAEGRPSPSAGLTSPGRRAQAPYLPRKAPTDSPEEPRFLAAIGCHWRCRTLLRQSVWLRNPDPRHEFPVEDPAHLACQVQENAVLRGKIPLPAARSPRSLRRRGRRLILDSALTDGWHRKLPADPQPSWP